MIASVYEPVIKNWFQAPTTQISIFILLVSAGWSLYSAFSLWVSRIYSKFTNKKDACCPLPKDRGDFNFEKLKSLGKKGFYSSYWGGGGGIASL